MENMENIPVIFSKCHSKLCVLMAGVDLFEIQSRKFLPPLISVSFKWFRILNSFRKVSVRPSNTGQNWSEKNRNPIKIVLFRLRKTIFVFILHTDIDKSLRSENSVYSICKTKIMLKLHKANILNFDNLKHHGFLQLSENMSHWRSNW